ncbi:hypothetical protein [Rosenbergiella australiborealis]|uniref:hypothetical protein n=1 Tax=Rosenbergiella australiborealis TaxID=1544696 RepID=UPI001F4DAC6D|nr:hypothetical protein [Rosenbergiella australiborealis]
MKYFSLLTFIFISTNVYATEFYLKPGMEDIDGTKYYTLTAKNSNGQKNIDIALEGNANTVTIRDRLKFYCKWGTADGISIGMSSQTGDGVMTIYSYYFFDKKLSNIFAKSYAVMNSKTPYTPLSLNHSVCRHEGEGVKKDNRTGKDYVENYEVIADGPFVLKDVPNVHIKYVTDKGLNLVKESELGDATIDTYKIKGNLSPVNLSVFFMVLSSEMNIINLISWGSARDRICYKVYAYTYDNKGDISKNIAINDDVNLSGCEGNGTKFNYKNTTLIKKYLNKIFKE